MKINNEDGAVSGLAVSLILVTVLLFITLGFGAWAFVSRQDYKDNSDQKVTAAVEVAKKNTAAEKDNEFVEKEKFPLKTYKGPDNLGGVSLSYPKTWSGYISTTSGNSYIFNPDVVVQRDDSVYALEITIEDQEYANVITQYQGQIQQGELTAKAYSLPKVPSVLGVRFDGQIAPDKPGAVVILPVRDKTIKIVCGIPDRIGDFNNIILPNLSFNP